MKFVLAEEKDKKEVLALYRSMIGSEGCTWTMDYPNEDNLEDDFGRNALFTLKNEGGEIVGVISIDDDASVEALDCWSAKLQPSAELARLAVKKSYQNQGLARLLLKSAMEELRKRGCKSVHFLVSKTNYRAINSYSEIGFDIKGESDLYGEHWLCYEKKL